MKDLIVFGGPNGAGKTSAAQNLLPTHLGIREFVNVDEMARGLSPFNPEAGAIPAARLVLSRIQELARAGKSFAFETTCAGRGHARLLRQCKADGYRVTLVFLSLPSPAAALARVARRVSRGGHGMAEDVVIRRFWAGLRNLWHIYLPLADIAVIYANGDDARGVIAEKNLGTLRVRDPARWKWIDEATR